MQAAADQAAVVNSQDLVNLLDKDGVLLRFPNSLQDCLQQRTYTFIPGAEAYPEVKFFMPRFFIMCSEILSSNYFTLLMEHRYLTIVPPVIEVVLWKSTLSHRNQLTIILPLSYGLKNESTYRKL